MRPHHLLLLALLLFGIAQFLPAFWLDMGAWNQPEQPAIPGYLVTGLAWPYYLSNLALFLGPLLVRLFGRLKKPRRYLLILFVLYLLTPASVLACREVIRDVAIGFYFWNASFCLAALGVALAMVQRRTGGHDAVLNKG